MSAAVRLREDYEARHLRVLAKTSRDADQIRHLLARALHPPEPHQDRPNQVILGLAFIVGLSVGNRSNIRRRSADRFPQGITGKQAALENPLAHPARPLASIRRASSMVIISVIGSTGDGLKPQCSGIVNLSRGGMLRGRWRGGSVRGSPWHAYRVTLLSTEWGRKLTSAPLS
jgi:hypothetical protein